MKAFTVLFPFICCVAVGCGSGRNKGAKPVVAVRVARAAVADVPLTVEGPATIFGKTKVDIAARITAPIQRIEVHKGDDVRAGQVLAVLTRGDLQAGEAGAAAGLADAKASLQKLENGTLPQDIERAKSDLASREAALNLAQKVYDRRKYLYQQGAISGRELQTSEADRAEAKANYDIAKTALETVEHRTRGNDLQIARSNLQQAEARLELMQANLGFARLTSPITGTVTEQFMYAGDMAKPDTPILTIVDLSTAIARAQVQSSDALLVKRGQACSFNASGLPDGSAKGAVTMINQAVDPARGSIEIWCQIPNRDRKLKAGLFGSVSIDVSIAHNAVLIPASAVEFVEGTKRATVYVVDPRHTAHLRDVTAMPISASRVRVLSGLSPGETVIVEGEYGLPDGTEVSIGGKEK